MRTRYTPGAPMDGRSTTCAKLGWSANARPLWADRHAAKVAAVTSSHADLISAGGATAPFARASAAPMQTSTAKSSIRPGGGEGSSIADTSGRPAA